MKICYQGVSFELDETNYVQAVVRSLRNPFQSHPLRALKGPIGLVSSNLFAMQAGTPIGSLDGSFRAAPLLKPLQNGQAMAVPGGFLVSGTLDVYGQIAVAAALGSLRQPFTMTSDLDPKDGRDSNLICFGSPSSNLLSGEVFDRLQSVLADSLRWGEGWANFTLRNSIFNDGADGIVFCYDSPWNSQRRVIVLAGLGPMGTLGACKLITEWQRTVPSRRDRRSRRFLAAVTCSEPEELPGLRLFQSLD